MQITFVVIASLLALVGNIPYLKDIIKGKIQPHPFTWFVWSIVSMTVFFGVVAKGGGLGAVPTFVSEFFTIIIFLFSLKYGFKNIQKVDIIYLMICLLGLVPWYLTKDPTISVIIAVSVDLVAFMPTIRKTSQKPKSENPILFFSNALRHILTLASLDIWNIATTLHSIAMITTNTLMTYLILRNKVKKNKKQYKSFSTSY